MKSLQLLTNTLFAAAAILLAGCASSRAPGTAEIDRFIEATLQAYSVPGAVVGVIRDGRIVHAQAYGVRELGIAEPMNTQTLFRIASTSKAMTAAALATLVDAGKLSWEDRVVDHLPAFQMYDPWLTRHFTVTDLLTHRSGLAPHAGDLMLWPKPNRFKRDDIIQALRHFKPQREFRTGYDYDNLLYIVAGELIPAITGQSWQDYVDEYVLGRLGVQRCFAGDIPDSEMHNLAAPHAIVEGDMQLIERNRIQRATAVAAAAGGVRCSLDDMLRWLQVQLARGALSDGARLFSEQQSARMWAPVTLRTVSRVETARDRTHFKAYGLGWRLADVQGYKQVHHTGSFTGFNSEVLMIPEMNLGAVVMLNASAGSARAAIMNSLIRPWLGQTGIDWLEYYRKQDAAREAAAEPIDNDYRNGQVDADLSSYVSSWVEPWFGRADITLVNGELRFESQMSPKLSGRLWPQQEHTFQLRWQDRSAERDVLVDFIAGGNGEFERIEIRCLAESIPCSFVDQEMNFRRIEAE